MAGLSRRKPLRRRAGLSARSARQAASDAELAASKRIVWRRDGGTCQAEVAPNCEVAGAHVHHLVMRSRARRWTGLHEPDNLLLVCHPCHHWIHANPAQATSLDLLRRAPIGV